MQDCYALEGIKALKYKMPDIMTGITYVVESCYYKDPMGVHQWWTFFNNNKEHSELIFHSYLNCTIY